jgi:hypothetical protein
VVIFFAGAVARWVTSTIEIPTPIIRRRGRIIRPRMPDSARSAIFPNTAPALANP